VSLRPAHAPTVCPKLTFEVEVDRVEIGGRAATWLHLENRDGYGAWIDPKIFEVPWLGIELAQPWPLAHHRTDAPRIPRQRRASD